MGVAESPANKLEGKANECVGEGSSWCAGEGRVVSAGEEKEAGKIRPLEEKREQFGVDYDRRGITRQEQAGCSEESMGGQHQKLDGWRNAGSKAEGTREEAYGPKMGYGLI